ncbi:Sulfatase [Rubritalea squalenifaciens DSM 18772]|uniref:Sulfatase n=2 Tax=Rubritalea squalenifaciens TaxID=407226 RepID=A0A1M6ETT9_9BACT|nr:Sulfatase [Rubritalea squalenifaciens DSM 18772]
MPKNILHSLLWIGGLLFGITPFIAQHQYGETKVSPYMGENYFGSHILILLGLMAAGSFMWGGLARWLRFGDSKAYQAKTWSITALVILTVIVSLGLSWRLTGYSYLLTGAAGWIAVAFGSIHFSKHPGPTYSDFKSIVLWLAKPHHWNAVFFGTLFALLLWHNHQMISSLRSLDGAHKFSLFINRFFTQISFIGVLYFVIQLSIETGPRWSRVFIWSCASLAPIAIILDHFFVGFWSNTLMDYLNNLGFDGLLNMADELKGGGIQVGVVTFFSICILVLVLFSGITWLTIHLSKRFDFKIRPIVVMALIVLGFGGATLEQSLGQSWKTRRNWMREYAAFELQISTIRPPEGLAFFEVKFRDHHWAQDAIDDDRELRITRKPDIYIVFIESFRADSLTREITPFLHLFKSEEAQPISHGWACSNGTHLGWYGSFTSQIPLQWEDSRAMDRELNWPGLYAFRLLKQSGYNLSIFAPSDLAFREMGPHFFSTENKLFTQHLIHDEDLPLPEREVALLEKFKGDLASQQNGSHFTLFAIDSSHFMYTWHKDFNPPFMPYHTGSFFPSSPDDQELQEVLNKYYNSLAWADKLAKDFCQSLKDADKYDDSIVIILGDHGEEFQDNGGWLHVSSLENEQVAVPIMIKWPKSHGRGPLLNDVSQLDIMPGILDYLTEGNPPANTAGLSVLQSEERTAIATTAQGGKTREAMLLARNGYKAYFTWQHYWNGRPPNSITLSRMTGPEGDIILPTENDYLDTLKKHFPDAFPRFFHSFHLKPQTFEK